MKQFILRRLLLAVVTLVGVSWLIFAIMAFQEQAPENVR